MNQPGIQLIVNSDDLGRTIQINEGVQTAFRTGLVSSTSLVANSPAFDHALTVLRANPTLGVGVHLTLHEYPPLTDSPYLRSLSNKGFVAAFGSLAYATPGQVRLVEQEWRRQIEKVLAQDLPIDHLDGHNHVHVHPRLTGVLSRLAKEYGVHNVRLPRESLAYGKRPGRYLQKFILTLVCTWDTFFLRPHVRWPTHFHGFTEGGELTRDRLPGILQRLRPGVNELMCHVGADNDDPPFHIHYHWLDELKAVTSFTKEQLLNEFGNQVVSYSSMK
jgi:predicted glycoside hydrolase/deacetylase ChbG (UPF0249 family)